MHSVGDILLLYCHNCQTLYTCGVITNQTWLLFYHIGLPPPTRTPLQVYPGDTLLFNCTNGSNSNVWYQVSVEGVDLSANCNTVPQPTMRPSPHLHSELVWDAMFLLSPFCFSDNWRNMYTPSDSPFRAGVCTKMLSEHVHPMHHPCQMFSSLAFLLLQSLGCCRLQDCVVEDKTYHNPYTVAWVVIAVPYVTTAL